MRQIVMVGFLQAQNYTNLVSSCRHPACVPTVMPQSTTDTSEASSNRANFTCFFDDRLAMPDRFGGNHAHTVHYGIRCVKMDPVAVLMTMGTAPNSWVKPAVKHRSGAYGYIFICACRRQK